MASYRRKSSKTGGKKAASVNITTSVVIWPPTKLQIIPLEQSRFFPPYTPAHREGRQSER
jgi:hypothetical protein